jgi:hypothetical protein
MDSAATKTLIQQYEQILADRKERFSSDAVFGGAKYQFEKALLEEIACVREPDRTESLQLMFRELASFVPPSDYDLIDQCLRRGAEDSNTQRVLDLIDQGDHAAVQKELESRAVPELVRYYALYRRVLLETEARRQQAASVHALGAES